MKHRGFKVVLKSLGNPDHGQFFGSGVLSPTKARHCDSIEDCQSTVRKYIEDYDLGGGNWIGGQVSCGTKHIGRISYNGKFWPSE